MDTLIRDHSDPYSCFYCSTTPVISQVLQPKSLNKWYRGRHSFISLHTKIWTYFKFVFLISIAQIKYLLRMLTALHHSFIWLWCIHHSSQFLDWHKWWTWGAFGGFPIQVLLLFAWGWRESCNFGLWSWNPFSVTGWKFGTVSGFFLSICNDFAASNA